MMKKPEVVCLCGSSRFVADMAVIAWEMEKQGKITLGLHLLPQGYTEKAEDHLAEKEGVAEKMDELHLRKIDLADRVFVVNIKGYIGKSTKREIEYARKAGKPVMYLEPLDGEERPMKCPSCDGRGKSEGIACGELGELRCRVMVMPCPLCQGTGEIDNERLQAWEYGRKMRADRLKENRTLREEATARGIDVVTLSKMERGEIDARPQPPR